MRGLAASSAKTCSQPCGGWLQANGPTWEAAATQEDTCAACTMSLGSDRPAPPSRTGRADNLQCGSETSSPRMVHQVRRMRGLASSAAHRATVGSAVRRIQASLHEDMHCLSTSEAARGSPRPSSLPKAHLYGSKTFNVTQSLLESVLPTGHPKIGMHPVSEVLGIPTKRCSGVVSFTKRPHLALLRTRPIVRALASACWRTLLTATRGPAMYPSSRYQCDHPPAVLVRQLCNMLG